MLSIILLPISHQIVLLFQKQACQTLEIVNNILNCSYI